MQAKAGLSQRKTIAVYSFSLEKWCYFDGKAFRAIEVEPGKLLRLNRQPADITFRFCRCGEDGC